MDKHLGCPLPTVMCCLRHQHPGDSTRNKYAAFMNHNVYKIVVKKFDKMLAEYSLQRKSVK
jgi:hypothetical protein